MVAEEITVIIPAWGEYLRWLPRVVEAYRREGVEEIVVVTCGEDVTAGDICLLRAPQGSSVGAARNLGLREAKTPFVCFADADDMPVPGALPILLEALHASPGAVMASGQIVLSDGTPYPWPPASVFTPQGRLWQVLGQWLWDRYPVITGSLLRTDAVRVAGGFPDTSLAEDAALAGVLAWLGQMVMLKQPTRVYYPHPHGLCQRGRTRAEWRDAYRGQRRHLSHNPALPWVLRLLVHAYALPHTFLARRLEERVRYDRY